MATVTLLIRNTFCASCRCDRPSLVADAYRLGPRLPSNILGYKVQFREIKWYPNETSMWAIPLRSRLRVLYPLTNILSCVVVAVQIFRA
jgi:hypothetical protein